MRGILGLLLCLLAASAFGADNGQSGVNLGAEWEKKTHILNVMHPEFGARGNGTTDDRAAIQEAIDSAHTAGGGIVRIPPMSGYLINAPCSLYSDVYIWGSGYESRIIKNADSTWSFFVNADSSTTDSNIILLNVYLDGQQAYADYSAVTSAAPKDAIALYNMKNVRVLNCWVYNAPRDGIGIRNSENVEVRGCHIVNMGEEGITINGSGGNHSIHDNTIIGQGESFEDGSGQKGSGILCKAYDTRIVNNYIKYTGCGIDLNAEDGVIPYNLSVIGNQIDSSSGAGIAVIGASNCLIDGNMLTHVMGYNIFVSRWQSSDTHSVNISIVNNKVDSTSAHSGYSRKGYGIYVEYGRGHEIMGNTINNYDDVGIGLSAIKESFLGLNIINDGDTAVKGYEADSCSFVFNRGHDNTVGIDLSNSSDYCFLTPGGFLNATTQVSRKPATTGFFNYGMTGDSLFITKHYADNSNLDTFYVAESTITVAGWVVSGDTIFIDTSGGGTTNADSIRGIVVESGTPTDDYMLRYDAATTTWKYEAVPGGAGFNWSDSTGKIVGWGGVAKSVVNDTVYIRFEGSSDFDTTGGSVSIADNAVDEPALNMNNDPAHKDLFAYDGSTSDMKWQSFAELGLIDTGAVEALIEDSLNNYLSSARSDTGNQIYFLQQIELIGNHLKFDYGGVCTRDSILFYNKGANNGAYIFWDTVADRFTISDSLYVKRDLRTDGNFTVNGDGVVADSFAAQIGNFTDSLIVSGDVIKDITGLGLMVAAGIFRVDTADAVANGETKPVTGNAVYDWVTAQSYLTASPFGSLIDWNEADTTDSWVFGNAYKVTSATGDSAYATVQFVRDSGAGVSDTALVLSEAAGGADWIKIQGDTLMFKLSGVADTFFILHDGTNFIISGGSSGGLINFDSVLIDTILYLVSPGGTDTAFITNVFLDSIRAGAFGVAGTTDTVRIGTGLVATGVGGDTLAAPGDTISVDPDAYASSSHDHDGVYLPLTGGNIDSIQVESLEVVTDINLPANSLKDSMIPDNITIDAATYADSAGTVTDGALSSKKFAANTLDSIKAGVKAWDTLALVLDDTTNWNTVKARFDSAYDLLTVNAAGLFAIGSGANFTYGAVNWNSGDSINGAAIGPQTIPGSKLTTALHDSLKAAVDSVYDFDETYFDTAEVVDTILAMIALIDSGDIAADKLAESDINWQFRYKALDQLSRYNRALSDSIYLYDNVFYWTADSSVSYAVLDSAGNITADDRDTFLIWHIFEEACTIDSIIYLSYKSGDSGVVGVKLIGPDVSDGLKFALDSVYWDSTGANHKYVTASATLYTPTRSAVNITDITVGAGEAWGLLIITDFQADNNVTGLTAQFGIVR